jgi:glyoxylase-like metal-dependent hydrolase (beta-lactamase superfamily II)/rhodanese-related sulfurtransferase
VIFQQLLDEDLGCACYLIGDEEAEVAVVVDPPYAVEPLLAAADRQGVRLVRVIETHTHADHVSGHGRLALEHGLPVSIHPEAGVDYPHDPLGDGEELEVGAVTLRVVHSPGHRPEHCCLVVTDRSRGDEPWLVLTGDSLFVGDVARPDLAVGAREGAEGLFRSLQTLMELADGVEVFPGHVAGSLCGKAMSSKPSTTIGFERRFNPALRFSEIGAFIADAASIVAPKPPNLARIVELNRGPFLAARATVEELAIAPADTQWLDVRTAAEHLAGHRPGAVNVPVSGTSFGTKAGFILDASRPVTVLAATADEARRAVSGLQAIALHDITGFVLGAGDERTEPVQLDELEQLVRDGAEVIDVREKDERDEGYIPGSRNIPYRLLTMCCPDLPTERPVVTICESGARASIAASILRGRGYDARPVIEGGMAAWRERGGDTVVFRRCGSSS